MESVVHGSLQGPVAELSLHAMHAIDTYVRRPRRVIWKTPCSGLLHYPHLMSTRLYTKYWERSHMYSVPGVVKFAG